MTDFRNDPSSAFDVSTEYLRSRGTGENSGSGKCVSPVLFRGVLRPCHHCTSCAYGTARRKCALLESELDPHRPSYFLTLTYNRAAYAELWLPEKPAGELLPAQKHWLMKQRRRIQALGDRSRAESPGLSRDALERRISYREAKVADFQALAERALPTRPSIRRRDSRLWQKRMLEGLQRGNPGARLPRMVIKHELGSRATRRPHIHVLMLHPTPVELLEAVLAWGHLYVSPAELKAYANGTKAPVIPHFRPLLKPAGLGHVHMLPVTDEGVSTYVTKDLYRGQDAAAFAYHAHGVEPPSIVWPRNPGIGCEGWLDLLNSRWASYISDGFSPVELELIIQDTDDKRLSLRHRVRHVRPSGSGHAWAPSTSPRATFQACPPSVWSRFLKSIEPYRDPDLKKSVQDYLESRRATRDGEPGTAIKRQHEAIQAGRRRLKNWRDIRLRKGLALPDYADVESAFLDRRQATLRGGQVAALAGSDEPVAPPTSSPAEPPLADSGDAGR